MLCLCAWKEQLLCVPIPSDHNLLNCWIWLRWYHCLSQCFQLLKVSSVSVSISL
ncbi:uncharacterized protein DS421_13g424720 [Arachis hypogaea]|nr:uncharacterized protein DS421_13g424720 [Arachis hypogaea]